MEGGREMKRRGEEMEGRRRDGRNRSIADDEHGVRKRSSGEKLPGLELDFFIRSVESRRPEKKSSSQ